MCNSINKEQNDKESMRYRYVCKKLYSKEKRDRNLIILAGIIVYLIGFIPNISKLKIVLIIPAVWTMISELFKRRVSDTHKLAVDYHEYNDRKMFGLFQLINLIDNNNSLYQEAIRITSSKKDKIKFENMIKDGHKISIKNWYSDFSGIPKEIAFIMAQDENINWEKNQRKIYNNTMILIFIMLTTLLSYLIYISTGNIINIIFVIPIINDVLLIILDNKDCIIRCNSIIEKIGEVYNHIRINGGGYNIEYLNNKVIEIQLKIYENRKYSIPVPDLFYLICREKLQKQSNTYIESIKLDINKSLKVRR